MLSPELRKSVDMAWDRLWSGGISNPLTCAEVLALFLVVLRDDRAASAIRGALAAGELESARGMLASAGSAHGLTTDNPLAAAGLPTIRTAFSYLDSAVVGERNADIVGDVFEHVLGRLSTAGQMGQFRTPRHIIKFLVAATRPTPGDTVLDPACGTAGFLIAANEGQPEGTLTLVGEEVDQTVARLARANAVLHGMPDDAIRCQDSLTEIGNPADVILANPPFAGSVIDDRILPFKCGTRKTELLFLELMERRLRTGGRAGVVVPFGVLTARSAAALWVRRRLIHGNRLNAVIELPRGVFRPYTDVRTALLIWTGGGETDEVLLARASNDGFTLDDRRLPIPDNDLPTIAKLVSGDEAAEDHKGNAALVSAATIEASNYDLNPGRYIVHQHLGPPTGGDTPQAADLVAELREGIDDLALTIRTLERLT